MSTEPNKTSSGGNPDPGSAGGGDPNDQTKNQTTNTTTDGNAGGGDDGGEGKGTVSYDSHRKLLGEKKTEQERRIKAEQELEALRKKEADREKAELEKQGNFKSLLEIKQKELDESNAKLERITGEITDVRKKKAILKHIAGVVPEGAHKLLPLDMIDLDAEGKPTEQSAKAAAQVFTKEHSYAIQKDVDGGGGLPNDEAKGGGAGKKITYAQWQKLSAAEMKKQYNNVDWSTAP